MFHGSLKGSFSCAPGAGGRRNPVQWRVGRPAGGRDFVFAAGARRVFFFCFCCGCAASSLTQLLLAASEHPLQKDIQCPGRVFVFAAGALRAHSLTRCLPPGAPAARKKSAPRTHSKKKRAPHTQQKSTHNKKINTPTGFRANGTWHTVRDPQRT